MQNENEDNLVSQPIEGVQMFDANKIRSNFEFSSFYDYTNIRQVIEKLEQAQFIAGDIKLKAHPVAIADTIASSDEDLTISMLLEYIKAYLSYQAECLRNTKYSVIVESMNNEQ